MKRIITLVIIAVSAGIPGRVSAVCVPSDVHLFSRIAVLDAQNRPLTAPDGSLIASPEYSDATTCDLPSRALQRDVLAGSNLFALSVSDHRPKTADLRLHGRSFALTFPPDPAEPGTWKSAWMGVGYFDAALPDDIVTVNLCTEGDYPWQNWCSQRNFFA